MSKVTSRQQVIWFTIDVAVVILLWWVIVTSAAPAKPAGSCVARSERTGNAVRAIFDYPYAHIDWVIGSDDKVWISCVSKY